MELVTLFVDKQSVSGLSTFFVSNNKLGGMLRIIVILFAGFVSLGCTGGQPSNPALSPGETNALKAARQWVSDQGLDPSSSKFNVESAGTGWSVLVEYQPPTPGAHTLIRFDAQGKIIEVIPGA